MISALSSTCQCEVSAILLALHLPSREAVNQVIWGTGIVLQAALIFVVFRRGIARRFPLFTALITFFPVRAVLLLALGGGRIDSDAYDMLFRGLSMLEVPLLAAVIIELLLRVVRELGGWTLRRAAVVLGATVAACALAWAVLHQVAQGVHADRVLVLSWFVLLALFTAAVKNSRSGNLKRITGGFAAFSVIQLAALAGRSYAVLRHNEGIYVAWSYLPACGYLAVVVFWIFSLRRGEAG